MNTDNNDEPWVLIKPESYNYLAVPLSKFTDLMRNSKVVSKEYSGPYEIANQSAINLIMVSSEIMVTAQVRSRLLGEKKDEVS